MKNLKKHVLILFISLVAAFSISLSFGAPNLLQFNKQLSPDQAFKLQVHFQNKDTLIAHWQLAPEYMLYKKRIHIKATSDSPTTIGKITLLPNDTIKPVTVHGDAVYEHTANVLISIAKPKEHLHLLIQYQGCKGEIYCYPPQSKLATIDLLTQTISIKNAPKAITQPISRVEKIKEILQCSNTFITIISFFVFGLLLSFTPCVLPMLPILFGVIIGQKQHHHRHVLALTTLYVLSIAITFTVLGVVAGLIGNTIQALAQNPWVIGAFSLIFVLLSLSLFGLYEIQLPAFLRDRFFNINQQQKPGSYTGAIVMGCLSTVIISPCVTPPLIGALVYIGATGNVFLGGLALFFLGLGMGTPFILLAMLGSHILPKMGEWANTIKPIFGVVMLGMAIWLLDRILPSAWILLLSGLFLIVLAIVVYLFTKTKSVWKHLVRLLAIFVMVYGVVLIIGAGLQRQSVFYPFMLGKTAKMPVTFKTITNEKQLQTALASAKMRHKPVMLDFYAKWCAACQELEHTTFVNAKTKVALKSFVLLRVDLTTNRASQWRVAKQFNVYAPPSMAFFDRNGNELKDLQVYGYIEAAPLLKTISNAQNKL